MNLTSKTIASILLVTGLTACSGADTRTEPETVPEIRPGILQGYLPMDDPLESRLIVPPAPEPGSARQQLDDAIAEEMLALRGSARWELAALDANLHFPEAAESFSCALGLPITEEDTPALYMLLRRTLADVGLATYSAKNTYQRARPFMANGQPTCTPAEEEVLRHDGSYPSGHTSIGWGWGMILAQLAPERTEVLMARGRAFGESRSVCNVHWDSDVVAGRMVAAAAVATLQSNEQFLAAMAAAREDIENARAKNLAPTRDCEAEARALATP